MRSPPLAALAALAGGESRFYGIAHLRLKESDRIAALAALLTAAGVHAVAEADALVVTGPLRPGLALARLPTAGDHRIAMAAGLLALARPGCPDRKPELRFEVLSGLLPRPERDRGPRPGARRLATIKGVSRDAECVALSAGRSPRWVEFLELQHATLPPAVDLARAGDAVRVLRRPVATRPLRRPRAGASTARRCSFKARRRRRSSPRTASRSRQKISSVQEPSCATGRPTSG